MGWSTGSLLMSDIINVLQDKIPDDKARQEIYEEIIPCFESYDCDTLYECVEEDIAFHKALYEVDDEYAESVDALEHEEDYCDDDDLDIEVDLEN